MASGRHKRHEIDSLALSLSPDFPGWLGDPRERLQVRCEEKIAEMARAPAREKGKRRVWWRSSLRCSGHVTLSTGVCEM